MNWAPRPKRVFKIDIETKPGLRRSDAHHRLHRGCGRDREDPRSPRYDYLSLFELRQVLGQVSLGFVHVQSDHGCRLDQEVN
jgi:hypothetical protein